MSWENWIVILDVFISKLTHSTFHKGQSIWRDMVKVLMGITQQLFHLNYIYYNYSLIVLIQYLTWKMTPFYCFMNQWMNRSVLRISIFIWSSKQQKHLIYYCNWVQHLMSVSEITFYDLMWFHVTEWGRNYTIHR